MGIARSLSRAFMIGAARCCRATFAAGCGMSLNARSKGAAAITRPYQASLFMVRNWTECKSIVRGAGSAPRTGCLRFQQRLHGGGGGDPALGHVGLVVGLDV